MLPQPILQEPNRLQAKAIYIGMAFDKPAEIRI
jgi:hypothetical protein